MVDGALAVSKNFRSSRVLASGPLRVVFELTYPEWEKPGLKVTEVKRVTLDAGSHFNRFESFYATEGDASRGPPASEWPRASCRGSTASAASCGRGST